MMIIQSVKNISIQLTMEQILNIQKNDLHANELIAIALVTVYTSISLSIYDHHLNCIVFFDFNSRVLQPWKRYTH